MSDTTPLLLARLNDLIETLDSSSTVGSLPPRRRQAVQGALRDTIASLGRTLERIDPIVQPSSVFDPSNPRVVGRFTALALVAQEALSLESVVPVYGSGVYSISYRGDFEPYRPLASTATPIYVGQAGPRVAGARTPFEQGDRVTSRLAEHARNVRRASTTLTLSDFSYKFLIVQSGLETQAEDYLIDLFRPIWNRETGIVVGFGKHGDAATTRANDRSPWDTMHSGRQWAAASIRHEKSSVQITSELAAHFQANPPMADTEEVLLHFIDGLRQSSA